MSTITVSVVYITEDSTFLKHLTLPSNSCVEQAVQASGVLQAFPNLVWPQAVGIYGESVEPDRCLQMHDRVELYRPLICSPQTARRLRADKQRRAESK